MPAGADVDCSYLDRALRGGCRASLVARTIGEFMFTDPNFPIGFSFGCVATALVALVIIWWSGR